MPLKHSETSTETQSHCCRLCGAPCDPAVLDLGMQPVCNRFLRSACEQYPVFPLSVCYCPACALPQLRTLLPADELRPRFDWITYREPEPHLDDLVEKVLALHKPAASALIGALSYKDASAIERCRGKGFSHTWMLDPQSDLGTPCHHAEIETIQACLDDACAEAAVRKYGQADILIARHILEHTHDSPGFLGSVRRLLKPNGMAVFEIPDFGRCMELPDYTSVWEEHSLYFNLHTLDRFLASHGFDVIDVVEYQYPLENAVVAFARPGKGAASRPMADSQRREELQRWRRFVNAFAASRTASRKKLDEMHRHSGPIAIFGAGHMSCKFINFNGLEKFITFVADDDPNKTGLFMPGSLLPILPSEELRRRHIRLCLLGLSPESERKMRNSHLEYQCAGGVFKSIFPANPDYFMFG